MSLRPVLLSAMQFEDQLKGGLLSVWEVIDIAVRVGADGIELRRETWPRLDAEISQAASRIRESGLLVTYATQATLFTGSAQGQQQQRRDIEAAAVLGAPFVRFFPGRTPRDDDGSAWARAQEVVDYAAVHGTAIALENYARTPGGTLAEIQGALARIPSPALRTNLDVGNYPNHGQDVVAAVHSLADRIVAAHLKDKTGRPSDPPTFLGAGTLPLQQILNALDRLPQRVHYTFEFRGGTDPVGRIRRSMAYLSQRQTGQTAQA